MIELRLMEEQISRFSGVSQIGVLCKETAVNDNCGTCKAENKRSSDIQIQQTTFLSERIDGLDSVHREKYLPAFPFAVKFHSLDLPAAVLRVPPVLSYRCVFSSSRCN